MLNEQAEIVVYDPKVTEEQIYTYLDYLGTRSDEDNSRLVTVHNNPLKATTDVHAVAVLTELDEFKQLDWFKIYDSMLKPAFLFDGRKLLNKEIVQKEGFIHYSIGN